ncbi:hypothetical protein AMTR_s00023p00111850 [Amborella trichopoda]|uniref:Plant heme peroxidase family profile domain-containing protein n=1 Tax=Amborella trichopoda TaxID=13333 RepID=W1NK28_AMBTC|nr:hypothetical protein AMTR_s00023p00111850 [Amborella trichopoda]
MPLLFSDLPAVVSNFQSKGLNLRDLVALSGGHTIGRARCMKFHSRKNNNTIIDQAFASLRRGSCPASGEDNNLAPLDGHILMHAILVT